MIFFKHLSDYVEWLVDNTEHSDITNIIIFLAAIMFAITVAAIIFAFIVGGLESSQAAALYAILGRAFLVFLCILLSFIPYYRYITKGSKWTLKMQY